MADGDYSTDYFNIDARFETDSPFLVSSSDLLNDPLARDHFVTASFRRNHRNVPAYVDNVTLAPVMKGYYKRNAAEIEQLLIEERRKNPAVDAYFAERHYDDLRMETLATYPRDSVGNMLYRFCKANGYASSLGKYDPNDKSNLTYFMARIGHTHDLEHFLAGFGFDYFGEQGAVWIRHASYFKHLTPALAAHMNMTYTLIMMSTMTRTMLHYPQTMASLNAIIDDAKRIGETSEPIYLMNYDPVMHLSIPEAREALGYRNTVDRDVRPDALIWAEGVPLALDPRFGEDLPQTKAA